MNPELLSPIPGDNPAGTSLRYEPLYDQIKEARREDEDLPQGEWQTSRKTADWPLVIKLATDALTRRTKDLQLAAWLTEAWLRREGFAGLHRGLSLNRQLIEQYWDTLYPELDDGDAEMRAAPLEWLSLKLDVPIRRVALNREGHSLLDYRTSRTIPTEEDAEYDSARKEQREDAASDGKLMPEAFDAGFAATPKEWYRELVSELDACLAELSALDAACDERFAEVAPSFSHMRGVLQDVRQVAGQLLARKLELEPDAPGEGGGVLEIQLGDGPGAEPVPGDGPAAAAAAAPISATGGPRSAEEAAAWVVAAARRLRQDRPADPSSYLLVRGFRWGELRAGGDSIDPRLLVAPPAEIRTRLKTMLIDGAWTELLSTGEEVMAQPYGRGWLDLQRYVLGAVDALGGEYEPVGAAIRGALRTLLADLPDLVAHTLMDDSPTANADTLAWLREEKLLPAAGADGAPVEEPVRRPTRRDPHDLAMARLRGGDARGAMALLMFEAAQERSARARFLRRAQAAEVMVDSGMEAVALPILRELLDQVEAHRLEDWEAADSVAHVLGLVYRCGVKLDSSDVDTRSLYERICRLDPVQAIRLQAGGNGHEGY